MRDNDSPYVGRRDRILSDECFYCLCRPHACACVVHMCECVNVYLSFNTEKNCHNLPLKNYSLAIGGMVSGSTATATTITAGRTFGCVRR